MRTTKPDTTDLNRPIHPRLPRIFALLVLCAGSAALSAHQVRAQQPTFIVPYPSSVGCSTSTAQWNCSLPAGQPPLPTPPVTFSVTNSINTAAALSVEVSGGSLGFVGSSAPLTAGAVTPIYGYGDGIYSIPTSQTPYPWWVLGAGGAGIANINVEATSVAPGSNGPTISLQNGTDVTWDYAIASPFGGALLAASAGAQGASGGAHNFNTFGANAYYGGNGGTVSLGNSGSITVDDSSGSEAIQTPSPPSRVAAIGAYSLGGVGTSYDTKNGCCAGNGGNGGTVMVANSGWITLSNLHRGVPAAGIEALSLGGQAATVSFAGSRITGGDQVSGYAGNGGPVSVQDSGTINGWSGGFGILASSAGGSGLTTDNVSTVSGSGGTVEVTLKSGSQIQMLLNGGIGVFATSSAGAGSVGFGNSTPAGGDVTVTLDAGSSVSSSDGGAFNIGVLAVSSGTGSILQPFDSSNSLATTGGGSSGTVTVNNAGSITVAGPTAIGIAALSIGGAGILTTTSSSGSLSYLGNSGSSYGSTGGAVSVTNSGAITSNGANAFGVLAASTGGGGLINAGTLPSTANGSWSGGTIVGGNTSSSDGTGHPGGTVSVSNSGNITTGDGNGGGKAAIGIIAQSVGGGGGSVGGGGAAAFVGDAGGGGGNGGNVGVSTTAGQVETLDDGAIGILAQSIGGGGGNGANAGGVFVATGGQGGSGGGGGAVTVTLSNNGQSGVTTAGDFAHGIVAQSVGGGGGNGGFGDAAGVFVSAAIGGQGGSGGNGGTVTVTNGALVRTTGLYQSVGILAQSVGGGGGTGGAANSYAAGLGLSMSLAIGGTGGGGGSGGSVTVTNTNSVVTAGTDSIGVLAQSIGGGGGNGAAATAKSLAIPAFGTDIPTFSFTASLGASGGSGGSGGAVSVTNTGQSTTTGIGGHAVLAQSIGGGGGNGGDSTATSYAIESAGQTAKISVALGGSGGAAGSGGVVTALFAQTPFGQVNTTTTLGNGAAGLLAQSIGGGGGNSAIGSSAADSPTLGNSTGDSLGITLALGAQAGQGATGGAVTVTINPGNFIATSGSGSAGIFAQSIGGGGGNVSGGQVGASGSGDTFDLNFTAGGSGGSGGTGGSVTITNEGNISTGRNYPIAGGAFITGGGDSPGLFAQSIGGGGGWVGSSDASATISNLGQLEDTSASQIFGNPPSASRSANLAFGGSGGSGANGGSVNITNYGRIVTLGPRSYGIAAQSIGGGGGAGGATHSLANSVIGAQGKTYAANLAVGGSGGVGGDGGPVTITNSGTILTAGYGAHGIFAQSIGGGGGAGAEGTVNNSTSIGLGVGHSGSGGGSGSGGQVMVSHNGGSIVTLGDDAYGILGQSVGAGGGLASAGCSNSTSTSVQGVSASRCFGNSNIGAGGSVSPWNDSSTFTLSLGAAAAASGNGGPVNISFNSGTITTAGSRAFGIFAQSIGGGGGVAAAGAANIHAISLSPASSDGSSGSVAGGDVTVSVGSPGAAPSTTAITTSGAGAFAVLAQSIGGGGGLAGDTSQPLLTPTSNVLSSVGGGNSSNNGGAIQITANANITTTGSNAHGIVAQSIGGGGGIAGLGSGVSAGSGSLQGNGGAVTITQTGGSIQAMGAGAVGILAQSSGNDDMQSPITISIAGTVSGNAAGVEVSGGMSAGGEATNFGDNNLITVQGSGIVGNVNGVSGTAIQAVDSVTNVVNYGTINGSVNLGASSYAGGSPGGLTNHGILNIGPMLVASLVQNSGTMNIGIPGQRPMQSTILTGSYSQTESGKLGVTIDSLNNASSLLEVSGTASVAGIVVPTAITLLPGSTIVVLAGTLSSTARAQSSLVFNWSLAQSGHALYVSPSANFQPSGMSLTASEGSLAQMLGAGWNNADRTLAPLFGYLSQIDTGAQYTSTLNALSAKATLAQPLALANSAGAILGSSMSCPVFANQSVLLEEDDCVWAKVTGQQSSQWNTGDTAGYQVASSAYRFGGQHEIAPNWYLGGSLAAGQTWATANSSSSGYGHTFDGSVALKHTMGPWLVAGSVALASGAYHSNRVVSLPGVGTLPAAYSVQQSDPSILLAGARLRGAYEFTFADWYVRPYGDLDLVHTNMAGFQEAGQVGYALSVRSTSKTSVALSPMVEVGGRAILDKQTVLRPYAAFGVSFLPNNTRYVDASFVGALPADGTFRSFTKTPGVLANIDFGLQLYRAGGWEVKAEYGVKIGGSFLSQTGSARLAYHF